MALEKIANETKPNLEEFKKAENPAGKLIDFYIDLRYGISRNDYLKNKSETVKKEKLNIDTFAAWIRNQNPFPLKYLKRFIYELQIPLEEVIEVNNGKNPFKPDVEEFKKAKNQFGKLIDFYIDLRYGVSRQNYFKNKSSTVKKEKLNIDTFTGWIRNENPFPLKYLKRFIYELQIPLEEVIEVNNDKNPFEPDVEEFKKAKYPIGRLIDFYIDLRYGISTRSYLKSKSETVKKEGLDVRMPVSWVIGNTLFPLKHLKSFMNELRIPLEEVIKLEGKNPFKPDLEEFKKAKYPIGRLIDFYIDLRYGLDRKNYLKHKSKTVKKRGFNVSRCANWIHGRAPFPLRYLKDFIDELKTPLEEVIEVNNGESPFKPNLEEIKKAKHPEGKLIEFYIDLRYGLTRRDYLKRSTAVKIEKFNTIEDRIRGDIPFPLKYFKHFITKLKIPSEEIIEINNGKDPFKPDLDELKKNKNPFGKLIDFYIDLRCGVSRTNYLENITTIEKPIRTISRWINGKISFPLRYLRGFVDELKIPLEEVIRLKRRNPFKPDLDEFKKAKSPVGKLIDFYIDLRYGIPRQIYLKNKSKTVKKGELKISTLSTLFACCDPFPLKYIRSFADELKIPYNEVNYLINGDIEKGIAKAGNVSIEPSTEMILDSVKYYIEQYKKGQKERPAVFYPKKHSAFEEKHGISTRQIYRGLNR